MKRRNSAPIRVLTTFILLVSCVSVQGQEAAAPEKKDPFAKQRRRVEQLKVRVGGKALKLLPGPLYTYDEALHNWNNGTSWIWGGKGRPAVFLNMMTQGPTRYYEFINLSSAEINVETPNDRVWKPKTDWNPEKIEDAPKPSKTRAGRLRQMRAIAKKLKATQFWKGDVQNLDFLPQPIYRYDGESEESLDGALFAFVRRHDLETIAVIEAAKQPDGTVAWVIDCMPASIAEQEVLHDDKVVWSKPEMNYPDVGKPDASYHIVRGPAELPDKDKQKVIWRWLDANIAGQERLAKSREGQRLDGKNVGAKVAVSAADSLLFTEQLKLMRSIKESKNVMVAKQYLLVHTLMTLGNAKRTLSLLDDPKDRRRPAVRMQIRMARDLLDTMGYDKHMQAVEDNNSDSDE